MCDHNVIIIVVKQQRVHNEELSVELSVCHSTTFKLLGTFILSQTLFMLQLQTLCLMFEQYIHINYAGFHVLQLIVSGHGTLF